MLIFSHNNLAGILMLFPIDNMQAIYLPNYSQKLGVRQILITIFIESKVANSIISQMNIKVEKRLPQAYIHPCYKIPKRRQILDKTISFSILISMFPNPGSEINRYSKIREN